MPIEPKHHSKPCALIVHTQNSCKGQTGCSAAGRVNTALLQQRLLELGRRQVPENHCHADYDLLYCFSLIAGRGGCMPALLL